MNVQEAKANDSRVCRLLSLPPEIRNSIYHYALVDNEDIVITPQVLTGATQPSLLQVNCQTRFEATEIYYKENMFCWHIDNFDSKLFRKWQASFTARREARLAFILNGAPDFKNLMEWLEAYSEGECTGVGQLVEEGDKGQSDVAAEMFAIVDTKDLSWSQAKQVLNCMRTAVGVYNSAWLADA